MFTAVHPSPPSYSAHPETPAPLGNAELGQRYQAIVDDPRYSHFTRIPVRMVRFLDSFHAGFDREAVHERLLAHYLFTAVVDDAIDSGEAGVAQTVFDRLNGVAGPLNEICRPSDVAKHSAAPPRDSLIC
jgi:hypothetical protein